MIMATEMNLKDIEEYLKGFDAEKLEGVEVMDLAYAQSVMNKLEELAHDTRVAVELSDEMRAFEDAKAELDTSADKLDLDRILDAIQLMKANYEIMGAYYKATQLKRYVETGEKTYQGGKISVRKNFTVYDHDAVISWLIAKKLYGFLQLDMKALKESFNEAFIQYSGINDIFYQEDPEIDASYPITLVEWKEVPSASLAKDLSQFGED